MPPRSQLIGILKVWLWYLFRRQKAHLRLWFWFPQKSSTPTGPAETADYVRRNLVRMMTLWSPVDVPRGRCNTSREQHAMPPLRLTMKCFLEMVSTGRRSLELGRSPSHEILIDILICMISFPSKYVALGTSCNDSFSSMHATFPQKWAQCKIVNKVIVRKFNNHYIFIMDDEKCVCLIKIKFPKDRFLGTFLFCFVLM